MSEQERRLAELHYHVEQEHEIDPDEVSWLLGELSAMRDGLAALVAQWRGLKRVRDLGIIGAAFDEEGYDEHGFRDLRPTELKLLARCADELAALLSREEK